jgi:hypothetical protein
MCKEPVHVYDSPLQLFSGNLSDALCVPDLMYFLGKIPTVWDETVILKARLGKYILEARNPQDYKIKSSDVTKNDTLTIKLAPGGGYVARIIKK